MDKQKALSQHLFGDTAKNCEPSLRLGDLRNLATELPQNGIHEWKFIYLWYIERDVDHSGRVV
jgi:hypothetical protein